MSIWIINNIKMLYYDRIDTSEGIDLNKSSESKEREPNVCNRWHDLLMMSINLSYIAVLNIKSVDYCCIISGISKREGKI